jgi:hypothetical protein
MRAGVIISAMSHVLLVLLALFGTPKLFDVVPMPSIEVDLVPSDEAPTPKPEPEKEKPKPEPKFDWGLPQSAPPPAAQAAPPAPAEPTKSQQAALAPDKKPERAESSGTQPEPKPAPSIFDPASIPMLMDLPNAPDSRFDTEASTRANLSADERAAFKAHLRKCWKLPAGVSQSQTTRVVLRVYLRRDARLANDPVLIEARPTGDGPAIVQTALRAIKDCQPYAFLPPDKYGEWKVLDLSFTPKEMAGG